MLQNTEILKTACDQIFYNKSELLSAIEQALVDIPAVNTHENYITTVGRYDLTSFSGINLLVAWIQDYLLSVKNQFNKTDATKIVFNLTWITKLYKGSQVYCHSHHYELDGVAIFYFKTPKEGSSLVLVDNGIENKAISEQIQTNCKYFNFNTGDLVVHKSTAKHGVTEYTSEEDTVALVFDFKYQ